MTKLGNSDLVDLELVFLGETDKAFRVGYGDVTLWLPRSLVERELTAWPADVPLTALMATLAVCVRLRDMERAEAIRDA